MSYDRFCYRLVMVRAAPAQGVAPQRVSFIDALRWLLSADPHEEVAGIGRQSRTNPAGTNQSCQGSSGHLQQNDTSTPHAT